MNSLHANNYIWISADEFKSYILTYTDSDTDHEETPSASPEDINPQSAKIAVLVALQANSLQDLGIKTHLVPVAKKLGVRHRSLGKRDMLLPIARVLFQQGFLKASCSEVDFKRLKMQNISVCKPVFDFSPSSPASSSDMSSEGFEVEGHTE